MNYRNDLDEFLLILNDLLDLPNFRKLFYGLPNLLLQFIHYQVEWCPSCQRAKVLNMTLKNTKHDIPNVFVGSIQKIHTMVIGLDENVTCLVVGAYPRFPSNQFRSYGKLGVNSIRVLVKSWQFCISYWISFWCMLWSRCGGWNEYQYIEGQTRFGRPRGANMSLASNEVI